MNSGKIVTALIDSGATHSFVAEAVAQDLGATMKESSTMVVALADGSEYQSTQTASLELYLVPKDGSDLGGKISEQFQVMPEL